MASQLYASDITKHAYKPPTWREIVAKDWKKHWGLYMLLIPVLVSYALWQYGPMYGILMAFKEFSVRKGITGSDWAQMRGFEHFYMFFKSPFAWRVIRNTILINFWNLLFGFPLPIIFALLLNDMHNVTFKRTVQTITYMPFFISVVVICGMLVDFTSSDGILGGYMMPFLIGKKTNLLGDPKYFRTVYVASEIWQRLGWNSIIYLSALSAIDPQLYEAATIDGASRIRQVFAITLPSIMPTIAILLVLRVGAMMNIGFEKIILLYNGLTYETADVISSYVYRKGIIEADFSFATAVGLFNGIINFTLVVFANKVNKRLTETSLW